MIFGHGACLNTVYFGAQAKNTSPCRGMGTTSTGSTGALVLGTDTGLNRVLSFSALFPHASLRLSFSVYRRKARFRFIFLGNN